MKKVKRVLAAALITVFLCSVSAAAAPVSALPADTASSAPSPRADVIVAKFRQYNGKLQIRHWNETQGYWIDEWKTISID